jgi:iron complex outermembrane receptor protein
VRTACLMIKGRGNMKKYKKKYLSMLITSVLCSTANIALASELVETQQQEVTETKSKANVVLLDAVAKSVSTTENEIEVAEDELEVIEVLGIRGSLIKSIAIKRTSINVVDAISAEDIGKLPDDNIADALSRISGVTVNRDSNTGQAQSINVRGLSGDFIVTTLNGRKLATTNSGRNFHYDVLSSGIINTVEVAKSPLAHMTAGGIGATVDIQTVRPLDKTETNLIIKVDDSYQDLAEKHNPKFSVYSNYNFDDTFGIAAGIIYSESGNRSDQADFWGIRRDFTNAAVTPHNGDPYKVTADIYSGMSLTNGMTENQSLSSNLSLQWKPTDALDITFDGLYSSFDQSYTGSSIALGSDQPLYQNHGVWTDMQINPGTMTPRWGTDEFDSDNDGDREEILTRIDRITGAPVYLGLVDRMTVDDIFVTDLKNNARNRKTTTESYGLNFAYFFDDLTLDFDISHSKAVNKDQGDNYDMVVRSLIQGAKFDYRTENRMPDIILSQQLDADADWGAHYNRMFGEGSEDQVDAATIDAEWNPDIEIVRAIKFGAGVTRQGKQTDTYVSQPGGSTTFRNGTITGVPISDQTMLMNKGYFSLLRIPSDVMNNSTTDNYLSNMPGNFPRQWASYDVNKLLDFYSSVSPEAVALMQAKQDSNQTYNIEETVFHFYVEGDFQWELNNHTFDLNIGGRLVEIDIDAEGKSQRADRIARDFLGAPIDELYATETKLLKEAHQHYFLPSLTLNWKLYDDYVIKFATAKTVSRPSLEEMRPYESIFASSSLLENGNTISRSNPALLPYEAISADLSFEWYFSELGAIAAGLYYKNIEGFVSGSTSYEMIDDWEFKVTMPINNNENSVIKGVEFLLQQSLDDILPESMKGFGFSANYTYTDTSNGDTNQLGWTVGFVGMSESSYNFQLFYETENFGTRIAIQHRDEYLQWATTSYFDRDDYVPESQFVTWSMSYEFSTSIGMTASINNLTNESNERVKRELWGDDLRSLSYNGRTYNVGLKLTF